MGLWAWLTGEKQQDQASAPAASAGPGETTATVAVPGSEATGAEAEPPWWEPEEPTVLERDTSPPTLSTEARALESVLVSHFDGHDLSMPPLPQVVERTLAHLRTRDCNLRAVADDISEDQVIAAAVLRMTNSPLYRGLHKITALRPAVTRLGTKALRTLMMHESLRAAMFHDRVVNKELARMLWKCSLASACVMRGLSRFTGVDEEDAFLIGLLHDIGNVIVLRIATDHCKISGFDIDLESFDYLCDECHQEFGELVAEGWKLPDTLRQIIAAHHAYPEPDDPLRTERLQLQVTDMITSLLQYSPPVPYKLLETAAVKDLGLHEKPGFTEFLNELPENVADTLDAI